MPSENTPEETSLIPTESEGESASSPPEVKDGNRHGSMFLMVLFTVCILLIVAFLLGLSAALILITQDDDDIDDSADGKNISTPQTGNTDGPSKTPSQMVTSPAPPSRGTPTTTKTTNTPVLPDAHRPTSYTLLCTIEAYHRKGSNASIGAPLDGMCDFVFYDSLYYDNATDIIEGDPTPRFSSFGQLAKVSIRTEYGFSVEARYLDSFIHHFNTETGKERIRLHVLDHVYHFGILTLNQLILTTHTLKKALETLKLVIRFLKTTATRRPPYAFVGLYGTEQLACGATANLIRTTFMPDVIVILGHLSFNDKNIPGCRILPPNIYKIPQDVQTSLSYSHTFFDACEVVQCLRERENITTPITVSITMKARRYRPQHPDPSVFDIGNYGLFSECARGKYHQDPRPLSICDSSTYTSSLAINAEYQTVTAFSKVSGFTIVFDNSDTFRHKVCDAKSNLPNVEFGLAAFDVSYDIGPTGCDPHFVKGKGDRLQMIRKLLMYFRDQFNTSKTAGCLSLN